MGNLEIAQLRSLATLAALSSVAATAEAEQVSPSAVTGHIRKLERTVGVALVAPRGRGIMLTADGEVLAEHARAIVRAHDDALRELAPPGDGGLVLAATEHAAQFLVPAVVRTLESAFPGVAVRLRLTRSSKARALFDDDRADVALFLRRPARASSLVAMLPLEWVGLADADARGIVVFEEPCAVRHQAVAALGRLPHEIVRECRDLAGVLSAVGEGRGVTPLPRTGPRGAPFTVRGDLPPIEDVPLFLSTGPRVPAAVRGRLVATLRDRLAGNG